MLYLYDSQRLCHEVSFLWFTSSLRGKNIFNRFLLALHEERPMLLFQIQRKGVDAITQPRRLWPIGKDMAKMRAALFAMYLDAMHAVAVVVVLLYCRRVQRLAETRPAATGVILGIGTKQGFTATPAYIGALIFAVVILTRKGPFRAFLSADIKLLVRQLGPPLVIGLVDFVSHVLNYIPKYSHH